MTTRIVVQANNGFACKVTPIGVDGSPLGETALVPVGSTMPFFVNAGEGLEVFEIIEEDPEQVASEVVADPVPADPVLAVPQA